MYQYFLDSISKETKKSQIEEFQELQAVVWEPKGVTCMFDMITLLVLTANHLFGPSFKDH